MAMTRRGTRRRIPDGARLKRRGGKTMKMKVTKTVRPARLRDGTKASILKLMRTMIGKEAENKCRGFTVENSVVHNAPISDADVYPIVGSIPEGTGSNERLGDRIKPKSLYVNGVVSVNPAYNPDNKPLIVKVAILQCKDKKTNSLITGGGGSAGLAYFLRPNIGGTTETNWDGSTAHSLYPINTDKFKVFYNASFMLASASQASGTTREYDFFKWSYSFKDLPASLTWDEGTGDDCNNFAPFLVVGYCYADGTSGETLNTRIVSNTFSQLAYEDA